MSMLLNGCNGMMVRMVIYFFISDEILLPKPCMVASVRKTVTIYDNEHELLIHKITCRAYKLW